MTSLLTFLGGVGLFLLGMRLMTDGLKVAAGKALRQILVAATLSRWRGIASGVLITAIVQSSTAVIFATIGFVNAGLLSLTQAIGVIFGSNLGTTLTSWLVAYLGFNVNLQAMAMSAIALGMGMWVAFGSRPRGALGQALVGFGIFFLGIDVLRDSFSAPSDTGFLGQLDGYGFFSLLIFVLIGAALTVLMQSSSATLAVILTAAGTGVIPLSTGAAMVIGANVGTTSTALFAIIGATAPAKRAAMAHVGFNVITAGVALALFPVLLWLVESVQLWFSDRGQPAIFLAIFHTLTKLLGLAVVLPLTPRLVAVLEKWFIATEADESRPNYLDQNVQSTPALAIDALRMELQDMGLMARKLAAQSISSEAMDLGDFEQSCAALRKLHLGIGEFVSGIYRHSSETDLSANLANALRVAQYYINVAELALDTARLKSVEIANDDLAGEFHQLLSQAAGLLSFRDAEGREWDALVLEEKWKAFEESYQQLKLRLLRAATTGLMSPRSMAAALEKLSNIRRLVDQSTKAVVYLRQFSQPVLEAQEEVTPATT